LRQHPAQHASRGCQIGVAGAALLEFAAPPAHLLQQSVRIGDHARQRLGPLLPVVPVDVQRTLQARLGGIALVPFTLGPRCLCLARAQRQPPAHQRNAIGQHVVGVLHRPTTKDRRRIQGHLQLLLLLEVASLPSQLQALAKDRLLLFVHGQ